MQVTERTEAMRKSSTDVELFDDLSFESLKEGLVANINFVKSSSRMPSEILFGKTKINKKKYISSLEFLVQNSNNSQEFFDNVKNNFDYYEVYGNEDWSQIKMTSYYSPLIKGSLKKTKQFSQPLYYTPKDIVYIDIDLYIEDFPKWKIVKDQVIENKAAKTLVKGRVVTDKNGISKVVPYYKREEIDGNTPVIDKKEIIVYVDPVKAFFLQIQGSGIIELPDKSRFTIGYANQNGHPYMAIGSGLTDKIPKEKMSMQTIETYLRSLPKKDMQKILNLNPSYVFFQKMESKPLSYLGTEVVDGRTVATDANLFPKGTLAFIQFEKPVFESSKSTEPKAWQKTARFILDQDTGGAIRGTGRLDLYAGSGDIAEQFAGIIKNPARLYYLVPKPEFLEKLNTPLQN
ncbi:MAG: MltA domain-containing protein [Pseudobdellovibrio sp.]